MSIMQFDRLQFNDERNVSTAIMSTHSQIHSSTTGNINIIIVVVSVAPSSGLLGRFCIL